MFGKVMSTSDELMWRYFELLSLTRSMEEISRMREKAARGEENPKDYKMMLAEELITRFHGRQAADGAREDFERRFREGQMPEDMPEMALRAQEGQLAIANVLKEASLTSSTSEALRMIKQGAVRIDGERVEDRQLQIPAGSTHVFQVGKRRFARVSVV